MGTSHPGLFPQGLFFFAITLAAFLSATILAINCFAPSAHFRWDHFHNFNQTWSFYPEALNTLKLYQSKIIAAAHHSLLIAPALFLLVFAYQSLKASHMNKTWAHASIAKGLVLIIDGFFAAPLFWHGLPHQGKIYMLTMGLTLVSLFLLAIGLVQLALAIPIWIAQEWRGRRWVHDPKNGESYQEIWSGRRGTLYNYEPKESRRIVELLSMAHRQYSIKKHALILLAAVIGIGYVTNVHLLLLLSLFAVFSCAKLVGHLFCEVSHLMKSQFMNGAWVYEPPVLSPGRETVDAEKAHGFSRTASEEEAQSHLG